MMRYNEPLHLSSAAADALPADHLRLAALACLARFTGSSREHTQSGLRCYLRWCADRGLDPPACQPGGHALMPGAPCDGYPSGLQGRLPWWAGPEETVQDVPHQLAGRRYLQWGPQVIFGLGLVVAVMATLIAWDPPLTGHLGAGQLRTGDCLTGTNLGLDTSNAWPDMFAAVPCTSPHLTGCRCNDSTTPAYARSPNRHRSAVEGAHGLHQVDRQAGTGST